MPIHNDVGDTVLFNAICRADEQPLEDHDYRVTQVCDSPRIALLRQQHSRDIAIPASSMVASFVGIAVHKQLEAYAKQSPHAYIPEQRFFVRVGNIILTGQIDLQVFRDNEIALKDYKTTGARHRDLHLASWTQQTNCYAYLFYLTYGFDPVSLTIVAIYRDWSAREAKQKNSYPQKPTEEIPIPLWPVEQRKAFVEERIRLHVDAWAEAEFTGELPLCTDAERWMDRRAFVRDHFSKAQRPLKTCANRAEAEAFIASKQGKTGLYIVEDPKPRRCLGNYCNVAEYCAQYQSELAQMKLPINEEESELVNAGTDNDTPPWA